MNLGIKSDDYRALFVTRESLAEDQYVFVRYKLKAAKGLSVRDVAAVVAINGSLGTLTPLPHENADQRLKLAARVTVADDDGGVEIAYPMTLYRGDEGISQLFQLMSYVVEYNYIEEFQIKDIQLPRKFSEHCDGPRFGVDGLRALFSVRDRPLLGLILKPRLGVEPEALVRPVTDALIGGVDFVVDDELIVNPTTAMNFARRVPTIMKAVANAETSTEKKKGYFVNVTGYPEHINRYTREAVSMGATGILLNAFCAGFTAIEYVARSDELTVPIIVNNMGVGLLTRPGQSSGVSEAVIAKICRFAGADAVHSGVSGSHWFVDDAFGDAISALSSPVLDMKPAWPVAAGGVTIANLLDNVLSFGRDCIIEAGNGLFSFPGGIKAGAEHFIKVLIALSGHTSRADAHNALMGLAKKDTGLHEALKRYGYNSKKEL